MTIIVSKDGKEPRRLQKQDIERESRLQEDIYKDSRSITIDKIRPDKKPLLIIAREFNKIDHLGIDNHGEIYLIETKRDEDSTKRRVVAQVLDYGAKLWSLYGDNRDEKFEGDINEYVLKTPQLHLNEKRELRQRLRDHFGVDDIGAEELIDNLKQKLRTGEFAYLVVMDQLNDDLKTLLTFLRQKISLNIYGMEMEYYEDPEEKYKIMIPRIFGEEIKVQNTSQRSDWNDTKYLDKAAELVKDQEQFENLKKLFTYSKKMGQIDFGRGGISGTFKVFFNELPIRHQLYSVGTDGKLVFGGFGMAEDEPEGRRCMDKFREKLVQMGLQVPMNYLQATPRFPIGQWSPIVDKFIDAVSELINS